MAFLPNETVMANSPDDRTYGEIGTMLPYRPHPDRYRETLFFRFSERTIRRHWAAIMRGAANREAA